MNFFLQKTKKTGVITQYSNPRTHKKDNSCCSPRRKQTKQIHTSFGPPQHKFWTTGPHQCRRLTKLLLLKGAHFLPTHTQMISNTHSNHLQHTLKSSQTHTQITQTHSNHLKHTLKSSQTHTQMISHTHSNDLQHTQMISNTLKWSHTHAQMIFNTLKWSHTHAQMIFNALKWSPPQPENISQGLFGVPGCTKEKFGQLILKPDYFVSPHSQIVEWKRDQISHRVCSPPPFSKYFFLLLLQCAMMSLFCKNLFFFCFFCWKPQNRFAFIATFQQQEDTMLCFHLVKAQMVRHQSLEGWRGWILLVTFLGNCVCWFLSAIFFFFCFFVFLLNLLSSADQHFLFLFLFFLFVCFVILLCHLVFWFCHSCFFFLELCFFISFLAWTFFCWLHANDLLQLHVCCSLLFFVFCFFGCVWPFVVSGCWFTLFLLTTTTTTKTKTKSRKLLDSCCFLVWLKQASGFMSWTDSTTQVTFQQNKNKRRKEKKAHSKWRKKQKNKLYWSDLLYFPQKHKKNFLIFISKFSNDVTILSFLFLFSLLLFFFLFFVLPYFVQIHFCFCFEKFKIYCFVWIIILSGKRNLMALSAAIFVSSAKHAVWRMFLLSICLGWKSLFLQKRKQKNTK